MVQIVLVEYNIIKNKTDRILAYCHCGIAHL